MDDAYEDSNVNPLLHNEFNNRDIFRQLAFQLGTNAHVPIDSVTEIVVNLLSREPIDEEDMVMD